MVSIESLIPEKKYSISKLNLSSLFQNSDSQKIPKRATDIDSAPDTNSYFYA